MSARSATKMVSSRRSTPSLPTYGLAWPRSFSSWGQLPGVQPASSSALSWAASASASISNIENGPSGPRVSAGKKKVEGGRKRRNGESKRAERKLLTERRRGSERTRAAPLRNLRMISGETGLRWKIRRRSPLPPRRTLMIERWKIRPRTTLSISSSATRSNPGARTAEPTGRKRAWKISPAGEPLQAPGGGGLGSTPSSLSTCPA